MLVEAKMCTGEQTPIASVGMTTVQKRTKVTKEKGRARAIEMMAAERLQNDEHAMVNL
jgi:hypothetical protein